jgi:hypothetical protein
MQRYAESSAPVWTRVAATSSYLQRCLSEDLLVSATAAPPMLQGRQVMI